MDRDAGNSSSAWPEELRYVVLDQGSALRPLSLLDDLGTVNRKTTGGGQV